MVDRSARGGGGARAVLGKVARGRPRQWPEVGGSRGQSALMPLSRPNGWKEEEKR